MRPCVKKIRSALRKLKFKFHRHPTHTSHEVWTNENGKQVEFACDGKEVPDNFVHILAWQLETKGIYPARKFKKLLREIAA